MQIQESSLQELIDRSPQMLSTDAQLVLRDRYETTYGIFNHNAPAADHPFALVLMHWNEDAITHGPLHERMNQYIDADIAKFFHLNFQEWIDQPTYVCNLQLDLARERLRKEAPQMEEALRALREGKQGK